MKIGFTVSENSVPVMISERSKYSEVNKKTFMCFISFFVVVRVSLLKLPNSHQLKS